MKTTRKGEAIGPVVYELTRLRLAECMAAIPTATRAELIDAHRWCEANRAGNLCRKRLIADALRKMERNARQRERSSLS